MKLSRLVICILLLGFIQCAVAQVQFSKRYSFNIPGDIFASMLIVGDTIFISGVSGDTSQNNAEIQAPKNLSGLFDLQGNEIKHYIYNGDFKKFYETFIHSLIRTSDKGFALCGFTNDSLGLHQALFMKYDSAMNVTSVKEFKYSDSISFLETQNILQLKDGSFIIVGDIQYSEQGSNIAILKIDTAYNLIWWKTYDNESLSDGFSVMLPLTDTTILVGYEHNNEVFRPYAVTSHTKFMIIDTAGNVQSQWQDNNDSTYAPYGLLKTKDGGYAYCGRYTLRMDAPYDAVLTDGVITKLDSNFNLVWRVINRTDTTMVDGSILTQLHELPDKSLIAAGQGYGYNAVSYIYENTGWFIKVSNTGVVIWSRMYRGVPGTPGFVEGNSINDFEVLPDGGTIGCGTSVDGASHYQAQQAWLIRLDSMGCLIPGCDTLTATGLATTLTDNTHTGLAVYPNPASSLVYLLIKTDNPAPALSFKVYNFAGQLITTQTGAAADVTYLLHLNNYASGMYFIQVLNEGEVVANGKFVKE